MKLYSEATGENIEIPNVFETYRTKIQIVLSHFINMYRNIIMIYDSKEQNVFIISSHDVFFKAFVYKSISLKRKKHFAIVCKKRIWNNYCYFEGCDIILEYVVNTNPWICG